LSPAAEASAGERANSIGWPTPPSLLPLATGGNSVKVPQTSRYGVVRGGTDGDFRSGGCGGGLYRDHVARAAGEGDRLHPRQGVDAALGLGGVADRGLADRPLGPAGEDPRRPSALRPEADPDHALLRPGLRRAVERPEPALGYLFRLVVREV